MGHHTLCITIPAIAAGVISTSALAFGLAPQPTRQPVLASANGTVNLATTGQHQHHGAPAALDKATREAIRAAVRDVQQHGNGSPNHAISPSRAKQ